ncbi:MAG: AAA family ATPase [Candidatus Hodarchaeales archaeon]
MNEFHQIKDEISEFCVIRLPEEIVESENLVGLNETLEQLKFARGKIPFKANVLLYGPPGTGKTALARMVAKESGIDLIDVRTGSLIDPKLGKSLKNIRKLFNLLRNYASHSPAIVLLDDLDALLRERNDPTEVSELKRAVSHVLTELDDISYQNIPLLVIGTTNHPELLDSAVWRRFTFNIKLGYPDSYTRENIILNLVERTKKAGFEVHITPQYLVKVTEGATGADLERLFTIFIINALNQGLKVIDNSFIDHYSEMILKTKTHEDNFKKRIKSDISTKPFNLSSIKTLE